MPTLKQCVEEVNNSHILVDTCFLIDYLNSINQKEEVYIDLTKILKEKNILIK